MERIYNKLVRDNIPNIIKSNNEECVVTILNDTEYKKALEEKFLEELNEVIESNSSERIEELADMIEVITSLAKLEGKTLNDVINVASKKKEKRGGFDNKIFLEKVITK